MPGNAGMRIAHGDYYMFVDSDDYIEPDMIAAMVAESESRDADIVVCGYWMEYPFLSVRRRMLPKQCWNTKRGLELLQENKRIENFAWGKLYRASLLEGIVFPQCRFEDIYTLYRIFARAQRIAMLPQRCIIMCSGKKASQIQKAFLPRMHSCCGRCTKLLHTSRKRSRSFIRKEYTYRTEIILSLRS